MSSQKIDFKSTSDGWRGKLAQNFTFSNVEIISTALSKYLKKSNRDNRKVIVGYDTRFMSKEFADFIANTLRNQGIDVFIIDQYTPTPLLTFAVNQYKFPFGINVTASHNPPFDNDLKIRMGYGGIPTKGVIRQIESYFKKGLIKTSKLGVIKSFSPIKDYTSRIRSILDMNKIGRVNRNILVDTMHGTTKGILSSIFEDTSIKIEYLHDDLDPYFGGINPEPKFETTRELQNAVKDQGYDLGIAHDGDGDRIIAVHPLCGYLSPHDVSAVLLWYLAKYQKMQGKVLGSSTVGRRVKRLCENLEVEYQEIPVGFKNATEIMLREEVLLAAEENGGIGFGFYLPERDATLAAAKLIEADIAVKGGIKRLLDEIEVVAGKSGFCRFNYVPTISRKALFQKILKLKETNLNYHKIRNISTMDGVKITYENGDWLSIRLSGTEDVIRIYCEADSHEEATKLKNFAVEQIKGMEK